MLKPQPSFQSSLYFEVAEPISMTRGRKLVLGALLGAVALIIVFGRGWRTELDLHSGKERHVILLMGLPVIRGAPCDTEFSEWLGPTTTDSQWIEVAGEHVIPFSQVSTSWCYHQILHHLHELGWLNFEREQKRNYAVLLLDKLRTGVGPCALSAQCCEVGGQLLVGRFQRQQEPSPFTKLMDFWAQKETTHDVE